MKIYAFVLSFFIISSILQGQTIEKDTISLNEITIVSTTKTKINKNQVPATVSVIMRHDIDNSGESALLPVLSGRIPGLFVTERGVTGFGVSAGTINIRGVGSGNKVLMLLDGQPQWAGIFGHHLPDTYVSSDAERVEIIRGPASLLYGSNAMGGAINVITRKSEGKGIQGQGRLQYGSYNTQKYMANAGMQKDALNVFASINHDRSDGHRNNSKFYITNGFVKTGYKLSSNWSISGDILMAKFKSNNPGKVDKPMIDNWVDALRTTYSFSMENNYEKTSGGVKSFYNYGNHEVNDGWKNGKPRDYLFQSQDHNAGILIYQSAHLFTDNLLTGGVDYKNWGGHAWNQFADKDVDIVNKTVNETAFYLLSQQSIVEILTLNAGLRLEINEIFGNEWIPQFGIAFQAAESTTLKTSLSKGFRSPNIRDLYMFTAANSDLKPESMMNYDFSILQSFLNNKLNMELTTFYINGKDMIQVIDVDNKPKNINSGSFRNTGFEFSAEYHILPTLKIAGTYSFLHTNKPIVAAPKHMAFLEMNWLVNKFTFTVNTRYINKLYTDVEDYSKSESYMLLNAGIAYKPAKKISLFANGENLTAVRYMINAGYPMPKATVICGIDFRF